MTAGTDLEIGTVTGEGCSEPVAPMPTEPPVMPPPLPPDAVAVPELSVVMPDAVDAYIVGWAGAVEALFAI